MCAFSIKDCLSFARFSVVVKSLITQSFPVCVLVVQMGEEYYHAKDYTKALK